jgi:hypothetical protein
VNNKQWASVPDGLIRSGASSRAIVVYALLMRYANKDRTAWPRQSTLARELECSRATVERAVKELRESGWVTATRRTEGGVCEYLMHRSPVAALCEPPLTDDGGVPSRMREHKEREPLNEKDKLASQAPPRFAAVSPRAQAKLQAQRDALLDPANCPDLMDAPAERGYAALAAAQNEEDRDFHAAVKARRGARAQRAIIDEINTFEDRPAPSRGVRTIDGDSPMGLALGWRRRMQEARVAGALDTNVKALARFFKVMLQEGATPEQIRMMANLFAEHEGLRNDAVAPWRDFLYQRHLLLRRTRRALDQQAALADPASAYGRTDALREALDAQAREHRESYAAYLAAV